jgi:hypothetical protein
MVFVQLQSAAQIYDAVSWSKNLFHIGFGKWQLKVKILRKIWQQIQAGA